jgi:membrane associated rhomboid family serine protease
MFVALYAALELFLGVSGAEGGVAHFAHLGGLVGGFALLHHWRGASNRRRSVR